MKHKIIELCNKYVALGCGFYGRLDRILSKTGVVEIEKVKEKCINVKGLVSQNYNTESFLELLESFFIHVVAFIKHLEFGGRRGQKL